MRQICFYVGWVEMQRYCALGEKLQNYFGQVDVIVIHGYLSNLFIAAIYLALSDPSIILSSQ